LTTSSVGTNVSSVRRSSSAYRAEEEELETAQGLGLKAQGIEGLRTVPAVGWLEPARAGELSMP